MTIEPLEKDKFGPVLTTFASFKKIGKGYKFHEKNFYIFFFIFFQLWCGVGDKPWVDKLPWIHSRVSCHPPGTQESLPLSHSKYTTNSPKPFMT